MADLNPDDLSQVSTQTLDHYNQRADAFWEGTRDHDVRQNIDALLTHLHGTPPFTLLDFGCGPGRDLKTFHDLGHRAIGLDGSHRFVEMAQAHSGCEVWQQDFLTLKLPNQFFDGIYANASLFHLPSQELPRILRQLREALKPNGVLFASNPRGQNQEGWQAGRYGSYYDWESWSRVVTAAGFIELTHYYRPDGKPRDEQPWLASVWRRVD